MRAGAHYEVLGQPLPFRQGFPLLKEAGAEGVELVIREDGPLLTPQTPRSSLAQIRRMAEDLGLPVFSVSNAGLWAHPLTSFDGAERQKGLDSLYRQMDIALALGARILLVIPGYADTVFVKNARPVDPALARARALEGLVRALPRALDAGLILSVENVWNGMLTDPAEMRDFVDALSSPAVGTYFDTGNALRYCRPEEAVGILGSRIRAVHIKDALKHRTDMDAFPPPGMGDVDFMACAAALRRTGYDGYLTAELHKCASYENAKKALLLIRALIDGTQV